MKSEFASDLFSGSLLTSSFSYEHALSFFCSSVFAGCPALISITTVVGAEPAGHNAAAPFPNNKRNPDRLLLRRAALQVPKEGGIARRLTSGPGYTSFPRFSPDGSQIAFTSQYDGNTEVYVMPAEGGAPKRLTITATLGRDDISDRMGPNNIVMTWQNTKPLIVFRTRMKSFDAFIGQLYTVGLDAELPQQVPVPRGGFVSFSPDDSKMAYNRVFREFRTWKHYRGGMADDVWIHDFKTGKTENLTNDPAQDICPMWGADNRIYFLSDRDGRMNLFSTDLTGKETKQLTTFKDFDIKFPSIGKDSIVFEQAGYIWRYDLATGQATPVPIEIKEDFASGRSALVDASKHIESVSPAPDGQRVIVVARGDIYSVPGKDGTPRNLTRTSNAHERDAVWSPDGKWIAYNSDVDRRERALCSLAGWQGRAATTDQGRRHLLLSGDLVARQQEAALGGSVAEVALRRCGEQSHHPGRSR